MTIQKIRLGTNEDGSPLWHYQSDGHVVLTGPIMGSVVLPDGSEVNVSDAVVEADSPEHAAAIAHEIGNRYTVEGHPADENYVYTPPTDEQAEGLQMALASSFAENAALNGLDGTGSTNVIPFASLHTASPSTTGANENANTGSYARQGTVTWNAASGGTKTNSTALTFSTAGSVAVTHLGTWSSVTYAAGNFAIGAALGSSVTAVTITIASGAVSLTAS